VATGITHEDAVIVRVDGKRLWKRLWTPSKILTLTVTYAGTSYGRIRQEERAATPGERLAVRGQAACSRDCEPPAPVPVLGSLQGTSDAGNRRTAG
jgi:hypothetical protein